MGALAHTPCCRRHCDQGIVQVGPTVDLCMLHGSQPQHVTAGGSQLASSSWQTIWTCSNVMASVVARSCTVHLQYVPFWALLGLVIMLVGCAISQHCGEPQISGIRTTYVPADTCAACTELG